jgi:diacylglycerol kinase family enzyme
VRLTVVYNPKSGDRGWPRSAIDERLRALGHDVRLVSAKGEWREALDDPTDAFVAAGGDGTVGKLARALAGSDRRMAILPLGTANNLGRAFGHVPGADPFARAAHWGERERQMRVECAHDGTDSRPFLEAAGAGAFARLLVNDDGAKRPIPLDSLMIARRRLMDEIVAGAPMECTIEIDEEERRGRFVMLVCLRTPSFGPALRLAPEQWPDTPDLTVVGVRNDQREAFAWWLATGEGEVRDYLVGVGRRVTLTAAAPMHADDKLIAVDGDDHRLTMGGEAKRVRLLV